MPDVIEKLEKLKHVDLAAELSWCWVSFQNDQNPEGVIEAGLFRPLFDIFKTMNQSLDEILVYEIYHYSQAW